MSAPNYSDPSHAMRYSIQGLRDLLPKTARQETTSGADSIPRPVHDIPGSTPGEAKVETTPPSRSSGSPSSSSFTSIYDPPLAENLIDSPLTPPSRSLVDLIRRLATKGPIKTLPTSRRVRILFNGAMIADTLGTSGALYVWEHDYYPQFYLPMEAFFQPPNFTVQLTPGDSIEDDAGQIIGGGLKLSVKRAESSDSDYKHLTEMVLFAADLQGPGKDLCNMVKVRFDAVGQWFEEDTPIYIHPKDPFKRVDILTSCRPIRILVNEVVVAYSQTSLHLYETLLPPRYYVPLTAVETGMLRPSTTKSQCPYKGDAQYHSIAVKGEIYRDLVWYYTRPTVECASIAGFCCFYNEKVDVEFEENGKWRRQKRPTSHMG